MKRIIVIVVILSLSILAYSQEKESSNIKYSIIAEGGVHIAINHFAGDINVVNGVTINNKHSIGLGLGYGIISNINEDIYYSPIFINYRYYFYNSKSSPFTNLAVGCSMFERGQGLYSSLTAGIKKYNFTFSSGIYFQANHYSKTVYTDIYNNGIYTTTAVLEKVKEYPVGLIVKIGITF